MLAERIGHNPRSHDDHHPDHHLIQAHFTEVYAPLISDIQYWSTSTIDGASNIRLI